MKAPNEVFYHHGGGGYIAEGLYVLRYSDKDTRYLCSDLTCNECYHMEQDTEDEMIWDCDWFGERRDPLRPACMAFKEKK